MAWEEMLPVIVMDTRFSWSVLNRCISGSNTLRDSLAYDELTARQVCSPTHQLWPLAEAERNDG